MKCPYCHEKIEYISFTDIGMKRFDGVRWRDAGAGEFSAKCVSCGAELYVDDLIELGYYQEVTVEDVVYGLENMLVKDREAVSKALIKPVRCNDSLRGLLFRDNGHQEEITALDIINHVFTTSKNVRIVAELDDQGLITRFFLINKL